MYLKTITKLMHIHAKRTQEARKVLDPYDPRVWLETVSCMMASYAKGNLPGVLNGDILFVNVFHGLCTESMEFREAGEIPQEAKDYKREVSHMMATKNADGYVYLAGIRAFKKDDLGKDGVPGFAAYMETPLYRAICLMTMDGEMIIDPTTDADVIEAMNLPIVDVVEPVVSDSPSTLQ